MDYIALAEKIFSGIRTRQTQLNEIIIGDGVKDWPTYQNLLGQMKSLDHIEQELKDLLDKLEDNESNSTRILQKEKK
jgi:hypothetical protein